MAKADEDVRIAVVAEADTAGFDQAQDAARKTAETVDKAAAQQARAGAHVAGSLGNMARAARAGSTDIAGMANQMMALGTAMKAGLGPIGWVMIALQGVQMAIDQFNESKTEDVNRQLEESRQAAEQLEKAMQRIKQYGQDARSVELDRRRQALKDYAAEQRAQDLREQAAATERHRAAERQDARARAAADANLAQERDRIAMAQLRGQITAQQATEQERAAQDRHRAEMDRIKQEAAARTAAEAEAEAARKDRQAQATQDYVQKVLGGDKAKALLEVKLPSEEEIRVLEARLQDLDEDSAEYKRLEQEKKEVYAAIDTAKKYMRGLGIATEGGYTACVKFVHDMQEMAREAQQGVEATRKEADALRAAAAVATEDAALVQELAAVDRSTLERARGLEDARAAQESAAKAAADAEKAAADHARAVQNELSGMANTYKVTGNYAVQDTRTQAEILDADRRALWQREMRLRQMLAEAQDADTRQAISAALEETARQQAGLAEATAQAAQEARKALAKAEPPDFTSNNRMVQRNLDRLAKVYTNLAKRAERQAAAGNDAALERTQRLMARYAERMGRMAKDTDKAVELTRQTGSRLDLLRGRKAAQEQPAAPPAQPPAPATVPTPPQTAVADAAAQAATATAETSQGMQQAGTHLQQLAGAATQTAETATAGVAAAREALKRMHAAHGKLAREVENLRRDLETML